MKFKYLSLIIICSICFSFGQLEWFSVGLGKETVNAILLTSKSVLIAGTEDGLYYKAGSKWEEFDKPGLPVTAIIELTPEIVAVVAGMGTYSDGVYLGKYSATVDPSYTFTRLAFFEIPHALAAKGSEGDTLFVGGADAVSMIVQDNTGVNPTVTPLKLPEYAFGVEQPHCASLLDFQNLQNTSSLYAGGYDKSPLPGKGHLLQQAKDSLFCYQGVERNCNDTGGFRSCRTFTAGCRNT